MRMPLIRAPRPASSLLILMLLALALRLVMVTLTNGADYDIVSYYIQAQSVLTHHNVYIFTDRYPYPPLWVWVVALVQWIAHTAGLSFDRLVRFPGIVGDIGIVALLQRTKGNKAALFYAINPVSILITTGHGQFDALVMALVVAAWALWDTQRHRKTLWAALALGGAIALKGYPVLLLPALLVGAASHKQRGQIIGLALAPTLGCILIYSAFFGLVPEMVSQVLGYQSPPMLGWSLYVRMLAPQVALVLGGPMRIAVLLFPVVLALRKPKWPLETHWVVTVLGFYVLAPGISPQYLLWAAVLLALVDLKKGLIYTTSATLALVFVYLKGFPEAVPWGPALNPLPPAYVWLFTAWVTNLVWWLSCYWLLYTIFRQDGRELSLYAMKVKTLDRQDGFDSSRPVVASQAKIAEKQAEN